MPGLPVAKPGESKVLAILMAIGLDLSSRRVQQQTVRTGISGNSPRYKYSADDLERTGQTRQWHVSSDHVNLSLGVGG